MKKNNRDLEFLYEIGTLRHIKRSWIQFLQTNVSSLSEHMYRMMWIALVIAAREGIKDTSKIIKMVLVHDIGESRTGDAHYISRQYIKANEQLAISDMLKNTTVGNEFIAIWKEYEERQTIEAKIVKDADNLDVDMDLRERANTDRELYVKWLDTTRQAVSKRLHTKSAKQMWREIHSSFPHDWHLKGRNRLVAGDWKQIIKVKNSK